MITTRNLLASVATAALIAGAAGAANAGIVADPTLDSITSGNIDAVGLGTQFSPSPPTPAHGNDFFGPAATFGGPINTLDQTNTVSLKDPQVTDPTPAGQVFVGYDLTFTVIYREAGFNNTFVVDGTTLFGTSVTNQERNLAADTPDTHSFFLAAGQDLVFAFGVDGVAGDADVPIVENAGFAIDTGILANPSQSAGQFVASFLATVNCPVDALDAWGFNCGGGQLPDNQMFLMLDDGNPPQQGQTDDDNHDDLIILMTAEAVFEEVAEPVTLGILGLGLAGIGLMARRRRLV